MVYFLFFQQKREVKTNIIHGQQNQIKSRYSNFTKGKEAEVDYIASIKNKGQLTLFGSSEFSDSPFVPYNFFPDSTGRFVLGVGHAHHQHFSVLIELLASNDVNENSEICVFLSPGWFENGEGTNTEAFIEFARPNFLKKILNDPKIDVAYKKYIADYIYQNRSQFTGISQTFSQFINHFSSKKKTFLGGIDAFMHETFNLDTVVIPNYQPELKTARHKKWKGNTEEIAQQLQQEFLQKCKNNPFYVDDAYFNKYLLKKDGSIKTVTLKTPKIEGNKEFEDLKMLVQYINERKMKASFVIIPYNPYYYINTEIFNPLINEITTLLNQNEIPTLNLFVDDTSKYEKGILSDVMHLGDYGWMRVNQFIDSIYYQKL